MACDRNEILLIATCGPHRAPAVFSTERSATCHRHEAVSNPLIGTCAGNAVVSAVTAPVPRPVARAAPGEVPKLDVAATCRADGAGTAATDNCMADEERAQRRLAGEWERFPHAERSNCTQLSSMPGFQSYVELLTCLEMAAEAKTLPKSITQQ